MKFSISKTDFSNAINIVSKGRSGRSTLPILSGIYIKVQGDSLTLQTTDLEISVQNVVPALVEEPGETVIPGKLASEIVKNMPDAAIVCEGGSPLFSMKSMNTSFSLNTMDPRDFPIFPEVEVIESISLPIKTISREVKKIARAASRDEASHAILTGINLSIEEGKITMAPTDSYRLAICEMPMEGEEKDFSLVVPSNIFDEVCKLAGSEEDIELGYSSNQIVFKFGNSIFVTRKIEGNYPNYRGIIPKEKTVSAVMEAKALTEAVKRVSIMAQDYMQVRLEIIPDAGQIRISSSASDVGGAEETIDAQIDGEELVIGFNYQYLVDGLNSIESQELLFEASNPLRPGVLKAIGDDELFYLSMPVKLSS